MRWNTFEQIHTGDLLVIHNESNAASVVLPKGDTRPTQHSNLNFYCEMVVNLLQNLQRCIKEPGLRKCSLVYHIVVSVEKLNTPA